MNSRRKCLRDERVLTSVKNAFVFVVFLIVVPTHKIYRPLGLLGSLYVSWGRKAYMLFLYF